MLHHRIDPHTVTKDFGNWHEAISKPQALLHALLLKVCLAACNSNLAAGCMSTLQTTTIACSML